MGSVLNYLALNQLNKEQVHKIVDLTVIVRRVLLSFTKLEPSNDRMSVDPFVSTC
jgi:hypothetical protein